MKTRDLRGYGFYVDAEEVEELLGRLLPHIEAAYERYGVSDERDDLRPTLEEVREFVLGTCRFKEDV